MPTSTPLIRRARASDAADMARLMAAPEVFANLMQLPLASEELWRKRLEGFADPDRNDLHLVADVDGRVVGSAGLHPAPQIRRRHVAVMGISVAAEFHRRGIGRALMQTICDYADGWAQILRIELTVFTDNAPAIALYEAFDFRHEGTHRAYAMRNGMYADVHTMARLHPQQPAASWPAP